MNDNSNNNETSNVAPYKATGNLNTMISNPSINIKDPMNVNIKTVETTSITSQANQAAASTVAPPSPNSAETQPSNLNTSTEVSSTPNMANSANTNRVYVTNDDKPKKKKITIKLGPEFKIALLIIVILLVFVFMLPIISKIF